MSLRIGIGKNLRIQTDFDWNAYWRGITDFWGVGRSGLTIPDVHGNDAQVLPSVAYFDGTSHFYRAGIRPGTADATGFIEAMVYVDQVNVIRIFSISTITTATRYFNFYIDATGYLIMAMREPTAAPEIFTSTFKSTNPVSVGWHKVRITSNVTFQFTVDDVNVSGGFTTGTLVRWISAVSATFANTIAFGAIYQSSSIYVTTGKIAWINYNDTNKWILQGQGKYLYDTIGAIDIPWVGTPSYQYDENASQYLLTDGYSVFKKTGQLDEYVPYKSTGIPKPASELTAYLSTYTRYIDRPGSTTKINLSGAINFDPLGTTPAAIKYLDRSNATYYSDAARTGHDYNAATPYLWRSEDIANPTVYYNWLTDDYKAMVMSRVTQYDGLIYTLDEVLTLK